MTATNARTMTLDAFLAEYAICRVWHCGTYAPTGSESALNTDTDCDEDYCDAEGLLSVLNDFLNCGEWELDGTVTQDSDGEYRWSVDSLVDIDLTDFRGNTVYNLTVWGEAK